MKKNKKKKYSLGTGRNGIVTDYIESPSETMVENDIRMAKAKEKAANNGWAKGLDIFGQMALQAGMGMTGGIAGVVAGVGEGVGNMTSKKAALGGTVKGGVEVEGGEVAKLPSGEIIEFEGPDHKDGGINALKELGFELPDGTDIYSKRVFDGDSMAKRVLKREKKTQILEKLLEKNSYDTVLKDTLDRTKENNAMEDEKDKRLQNAIRLITELGTNSEKDPQKFKEGGTVVGNVLRGLFGGIDPDTGAAVEGGAPNLTGGDMIGLAGTMFSAFEPMRNTEKNRAGDTPNINAFKEYGKKGLETLEESKGFLAGNRDKALGDIESARTGATHSNRKTARGVNQMRALDLASDVNANKAEGNIYDDFAKQMMGLLTKQAGFENIQDEKVMAGESVRDDNDRKDRDNYYSQLAKDISTKGQGIQQIGKMVNQNKKNTVSENLLDESSKGHMVKNGRVFLKDGTTELSISETIAAAKAAENGKFIGKDGEVDIDAYLKYLQKK